MIGLNRKTRQGLYMEGADMRRVMFAAVGMLAVLAAGCKKPQSPQTTSVEMEPPVAPTEELTAVTPIGRAEPSTATTPTGTAQTEPAQGEPTRSEPAAASTYVVRKGDTLWSVAQRLLGDGKRWKEIAEANPGLSPSKLPVGQTLKIPPK